MCCKTTRMFHIHINKKYRCHLTWQTDLNVITSPTRNPPPPTSYNKKGTHSVSKAFCTLANEKHKCYCTFPFFSFVVDPPRSVFEPRVSRDGGFAAVSVVVEQLLALVDVSGGDEDEVRDAVDVVEFGLAVSVFTMINQPTQAATLFCGVHTVGAKKKKDKMFTSDFCLGKC